MKADIENGIVLLNIKSKDEKVYQTAFPVYTSLGGG